MGILHPIMQDVRMFVPLLLIALLLLVGYGTAIQTDGVINESGTDQPPTNLSVAVQVEQEGKQITVSFRGGFGQNLLKSLETSLTSPDGKEQTGSLGFKVGDSVIFNGTGCGDQVTATATYMSGSSYQILSKKMPTLYSYCNSGAKAADPCAEIASSPSLQVQNLTEIPANRSVAIQANVDIQTINVEFRGGFGQNIIKSLEVTRYSPDGSEEKKQLDTKVGATVSFKSTTNCKERISADVTFMDGTTYHFYDKVLQVSRYH